MAIVRTRASFRALTCARGARGWMTPQSGDRRLRVNRERSAMKDSRKAVQESAEVADADRRPGQRFGARGTGLRMGFSLVVIRDAEDTDGRIWPVMASEPGG